MVCISSYAILRIAAPFRSSLWMLRYTDSVKYYNKPCPLAMPFFTGRNEVVAKVMFLHVSVILLTGGRSPGRPPPPGRENPPWHPPRDQSDRPRTRQTHPLGPGRPPRQGEPPPDQADTPPGPGRHPPRQGEPPPGRENPPDQADIPPRKKTAAYGQWAAGTHPTGMHSCFTM